VSAVGGLIMLEGMIGNVGTANATAHHVAKASWRSCSIVIVVVAIFLSA